MFNHDIFGLRIAKAQLLIKFGRMRTVKSLLLFIIGICLTNTLFSQISGFRKDNILLPDKLIISEHVGFDTLYQHPCDSALIGNPIKPFFEVDKHIDFLKIIAEKAMNGTIKVYDASKYEEFYPYTELNQSEHLALGNILKNLGQDTFKVVNYNGVDVEKLVVEVIELEELTSVNFIEDWTLNTDPLCFRKNVYVIEPVRRYVSERSDDINDFRYRKMFRLFNNQSSNLDKSKLKLAANVKYEHFFDLDRAFFSNCFKDEVAKCLKQNDQDWETNLLHSNANAPFFNGFNQRGFVKILLNNVFSGNTSANDYYTSRRLTPQEAKSRVFVPLIVKVINPFTGEEEDRTVENDYTSEIVSVIFIEEWYFDEELLHLEKKVVGIAPVRYFYDRIKDQDVLKREILFTVLFQ